MVTFTLNNSTLIYYSTILRHLNPMKNKRRIQITEAANFSYVLSVFYDLCKVGPDSTTSDYAVAYDSDAFNSEDSCQSFPDVSHDVATGAEIK